MAIIQTIRDKYAKLAGVVIGIALLGFVLMDFGSGGGAGSDTVAKVNGTKISYTQFENFVQQREQEIRMQNPSMNISDIMRAQLRDQAWEDIINQELLSKLYDNLGITVSEAEINDLFFGDNPDPLVRQAFTNPQTGSFNPQEVRQMVQQLKNDPEQAASWVQFEKEIVNRRYNDKLRSLINGGAYLPSFFAEKEIAMQSIESDGQLVMVPYTTVSDDDVQVTDQDLKNYIQKNAALYTNKEELRAIQYVSFETIPSSEDSTTAIANAQNLMTEFADTHGEDLENFIELHQSSTALPFTYFTEEQIAGLDNGEMIWNGLTNEVVGPFFEEDQIIITKVTGTATMPDQVTSQHIFVSSQIQGSEVRSMTEAKQTIDSAIAQIKSGVSFEEVARAVSEDNLAQSGGHHTFTPQERIFLDEKVAKVIFEGGANTKQIVEINDGDTKGYYYVEVLDVGPTTDTYKKIAFVAQNFDADKNTVSDIYNQASNFVSRLQNGEDFTTVAFDMGVTPLTSSGIKRFSHLIPNVGSSMELGKWTQDAKIGDHSAIIGIDDKFVIATLTDIQPKGLVSINDDNRASFRNVVLQEKKAEKIAEKYASSSSLSDIASQSQQQVIDFEGIGFRQPFVAGLGQEPKVIGYAANKKNVNKLSPAIHGNTGVIFVQVQNQNNVPAENLSKDVLLQMLKQQFSERALNTLTQQLIEKASVKDLRSKIYR